LVVVRVAVSQLRCVGLGFLLLLVLVGTGVGVEASYAQPDSVRTALLEEKGFPPDHSPRGALWRAAAVPGWGQFYNRQYYKMPFVYAGLAGGGYAVYELTQRYRLFQHANLFVIGRNRAEEGEDNPFGRFESDYNEAVARLGGDPGTTVSGQQLRDLRDQYRRWRDLSILGTGLFYALTVLDAYVSAHLLSFNVGEVAVDVRPSGGGRTLAHSPPPPERAVEEGPFRRSPGLGLRVRVQF
jgi:hypothetical protein